MLKKYWNVIRAAERKQNEVIGEGIREIRDAVNTLPAASTARAQNSQPERLSAEEVNALRALLTRVYEAATPDTTLAAAADIDTGAKTPGGKTGKGDNDERP